MFHNGIGPRNIACTLRQVSKQSIADTEMYSDGKKASVITFGGSEWKDISGEERLKLRKSALGEDSKPLVPYVFGLAYARVRLLTLKSSIARQLRMNMGPRGPCQCQANILQMKTRFHYQGHQDLFHL